MRKHVQMLKIQLPRLSPMQWRKIRRFLQHYWGCISTIVSFGYKESNANMLLRCLKSFFTCIVFLILCHCFPKRLSCSFDFLVRAATHLCCWTQKERTLLRRMDRLTNLCMHSMSLMMQRKPWKLFALV